MASIRSLFNILVSFCTLLKEYHFSHEKEKTKCSQLVKMGFENCIIWFWCGFFQSLGETLPKYMPNNSE